MPNPAFPIYESMVDFVGATPVFVPLRQDHGFRFDLSEFEAGLSERTRLVILNSPANPTGGVFTREDIRGIAEILQDRPDVFVLSDEIYSRLLYSGSFASIASEPGFAPSERTVILDGFSKTYAMTGWRLGYGVMPEPLAEQVTKLQVNSNSCTAAATQHAGLAEDVLDHRLNCRTVYMNPISRFIYWNMNYHVEHHMFPMVPYHALPRLHRVRLRHERRRGPRRA